MDANTPGRKQKMAIFFVFDGGTGIGHLRRLACLAKELQGPLACLIITGHRAPANWFIPQECEYIHLPSWDSLLESKAKYWGREPFILLDQCGAVRLRKRLLAGIVEAFEPDVLFVDHLPLGSQEELADIIRTTNCLTYFITRGILNESVKPDPVLGEEPQNYLSAYYDRVLVTSDRRVFDFSTGYSISATIKEKIIHTGYVVDRVPQDIRRRTREIRGLEDVDTWVVASAGGGQLGEELIMGCLDLAKTHKEIAFDIIVGPRSSLHWDETQRAVIAQDNLRLHKEVSTMPYLHASADVVISSGGYNSLVETMQGNARILCFPTWKNHRDEQYRHAMCLKKFVDLEVSTDVATLPVMFEEAVGSIVHRRCDRRRELDFNGADTVRKIVHKDLGIG
jgi:predicted glycosyltransferase